MLSLLSAEENELRPYKLIHADTLIANKFNQEYITDLIGNVHFFYGETEFFTDNARIFEKRKISRLIGNVKVIDDSLQMTSEKVEYYRLTEQLFLEGDVFVEEIHRDSTIRTFRSDKVEYNRNEKDFFAKDNVLVYDERENLNGKCGFLSYNLNDGYGYLIKSPELRISGEDSLKISSEKIEYYDNYKKIVAIFNVKTYSPEFDITSDFLLYFDDENKAIFQGNPRFNSDFAIASAREFQLFFDERNLIKAQLVDSCRVDFRTGEQTEKLNWVTSDFMEFLFEKGKISQCIADVNVVSYFKQEQTENRDFTINEASGKTLTVNIESEEIQSLNMNRNVRGKYKFVNK